MNTRTYLYFAVTASLLVVTGCKKDSPLSAQEITTAQLTSAEAWQNPVVTVDGVDYSDQFKDFTITFGSDTYSTHNGEPVFKKTGTWRFVDDEATVMKLDNELEVTITSISDSELDLEFTSEETSFNPGRLASVRGRNKIKLRKK